MKHVITAELAKSDAVDRIYGKVTWRILPFLFICYVVAYLDRVNIGFAKLQMQQELAISEAVYGLAAGIFFLGYVLFEIPSNLLLTKIGARKTISRILILWGITSACMVFVRDVTCLYILRLLLGVFEAGFAPGMLFYLTLWYPSARLAGITAAVLVAGPVASVLGGPLSGWIMNDLHGKGGLSGWQWMFLTEGLPAIVLGCVAFLKLTDSPEKATWLTDSERSLVQHEVGGDNQLKQHAFSGALRDPAVYALAFVCFCLVSGIYTISFWLPTLLQGAGITSVLELGLYAAIPYAVAACTMTWLASRSDGRRERTMYLAALMIGSALSLAITAQSSNDLWIGLLSTSVATSFLWAGISVFWAVPSESLQGPAAAGGIAFINSIGLLGGFVSPSLIGYVKTVTGSVQGGLWSMVAILVSGAILLFRNRSTRAGRGRQIED